MNLNYVMARWCPYIDCPIERAYYYSELRSAMTSYLGVQFWEL